MFCSKCHTEIREEDIYFCPRCGQKIENKKTNNHFYFSPKIKSISNEHEEQYSYSKEYSNVKNDTLEDHQEQYSYSKEYSNVKKDKPDEHNTQYDYSKKYSDITKDTADEHETQFKYNSKYSETDSINVTSDEDYVKAYIQKNYDSIKNKKFNIGALIFGPFYCFYRKMYFIGIILLLIESSFLFTVGGDYSTLIELFINLYLAIKINEIYLRKVNNNIETIKNNNPDKTSNELIDICSKKGGTLPLLLIIVLIILLPLEISIFYIMIGYEEDYYNTYPTQEEYIIREISYIKPSNFIEVNTSELHNYLKATDNSCYLNAYSISYTGDIKEYLSNNTSNYNYKDKQEIKSIEYNNKKWNYISMTTSYGRKTIYTHNYNNYMYIFTFEGECNNYENQILNTIEYKKESE